MWPVPRTLQQDMLNNHYARISTDPPLHQSPCSSSLPSQARTFVTEEQVFHILDQGCPTTAGYDELPAWFLRLAAPCISLPVAHLFNKSLNASYVPDSWKISIIHPIPKTVPPLSCSDFRPISITPILCRIPRKTCCKKHSSIHCMNNLHIKNFSVTSSPSALLGRPLLLLFLFFITLQTYSTRTHMSTSSLSISLKLLTLSVTHL